MFIVRVSNSKFTETGCSQSLYGSADSHADLGGRVQKLVGHVPGKDGERLEVILLLKEQRCSCQELKAMHM